MIDRAIGKNEKYMFNDIEEEDLNQVHQLNSEMNILKVALDFIREP
jgi:hypothetical protein